MKKILFALFAVASLASCSNNEVIELNREQIGFGEAFVDNATKADYSVGKTLDEFQVWGTLTGAGNTVQIFGGDDVYSTKDGVTKEFGQVWFCDNIQYWVPSADYNFVAIADATAVACNATTPLLPETIDFTVTDGDGDLLYAEATAVTDETGTPSVSLVGFTFEHLLSKFFFEVTPPTLSADYSFKVTDIKMSGVVKNGQYSVAEEKWDAVGSEPETLTLDFHDGTQYFSHQIIPVKQWPTVYVDYEIYYKGTLVYEGHKFGGLVNGVSSSFTPEANHAYKVAVVVSSTNEISFTVNNVGGFEDGGSTTPVQ